GLITEGAAGINLNESLAVYSETGDVRVDLTSAPMLTGDMGITLEESVRLFRLRPTPSAEDAGRDAQGGAHEDMEAQTGEEAE
ncbi:MAG: hypothetical protein ACYTFO_08465, partial [Planctomycetota bacterium]